MLHSLENLIESKLTICLICLYYFTLLTTAYCIGRPPFGLKIRIFPSPFLVGHYTWSELFDSADDIPNYYVKE